MSTLSSENWSYWRTLIEASDRLNVLFNATDAQEETSKKTTLQTISNQLNTIEEALPDKPDPIDMLPEYSLKQFVQSLRKTIDLI